MLERVLRSGANDGRLLDAFCLLRTTPDGLLCVPMLFSARTEADHDVVSR